MEKIKQYIKKYLADIFIITGILILSYNILKPSIFELALYEIGNPRLLFAAWEWKILAIILIVIGIDIAIRKYIFYKNKDN